MSAPANPALVRHVRGGRVLSSVTFWWAVHDRARAVRLFCLHNVSLDDRCGWCREELELEA